MLGLDPQKREVHIAVYTFNQYMGLSAHNNTFWTSSLLQPWRFKNSKENTRTMISMEENTELTEDNYA